MPLALLTETSSRLCVVLLSLERVARTETALVADKMVAERRGWRANAERWHENRNTLERKAEANEMRRSKATTLIIAWYAILGGMAFFVVQTSKLLRPDSANAEMATSPLGRFDWGYVWSDTLVAGPALLIGGILLFSKKHAHQRLGRLLVFTGFAINLYAMICIWIGFWALGRPMLGSLLWSNIILTFLGVLCMIYLAIQVSKEETSVQQPPAQPSEPTA